MIRLVVTRLEDDGAETDLGELRLSELGAPPAVCRDTADGREVMRDVRAALACLAPETLAAVRRETMRAAECTCTWVARLGNRGRLALNGDCPVHAPAARVTFRARRWGLS